VPGEDELAASDGLVAGVLLQRPARGGTGTSEHVAALGVHLEAVVVDEQR
jgi:hypothetical protein